MKMKNCFALFVLQAAFFFLSCGKKVDDAVPIPPGVLGKTEFADLLIDFALAESAANLNIKNVSIPQLDSAYAFDPLRDHKISKSLYDSTLLFYSEHPELYRMVYDTVLVRLGALKVSREKTKKDSLTK
jgi:hypothetical protein